MKVETTATKPIFYSMSLNTWIKNCYHYINFYLKAYCSKYFKNITKNNNEKKGYQLILEDDFENPIDWTKWKPNEAWGNERDKLVYKDSQVLTSESNLILTSDLNNIVGEKLVKSGGIFSWNFFNVKYGYFESRMKLPPAGIRYWPAFWLSSSDSWPPEIDILELMGNDSSFFTMTLHWRNIEKNADKLKEVYNRIDFAYDYEPIDFEDAMNFLKRYPISEDKQRYIDELENLTTKESKGRRLKFPKKDFLNKDFHTFACEWTEYKVSWYVDNLLVYELDKHVPSRNMFILITNGYTYDDKPISSQLPMNTYCDYIRVYKKFNTEDL